MSSFEDVVADWMRSDWSKSGDYKVQSVASVAAHGSDWAGDTEGGFYSQSDVTITYVTPDGETKQTDVDGEDMADLWSFVMKAWPA